MATGLIALLDDIAAIAKVAAASLDDTAALTAKASAKAAGVVIDDAAVTPRYVTGFSAARELPIVGKIALGSFRNKLLYLLPVALALSTFAPWAITPLLMAGGAYLCFEGAEKLYEKAFPHPEAVAEEATDQDSAAVEKAMVAGAIRTDLILSGEIMAITLAQVADTGLVSRAVVLAVVGIGITVAVYGAVALIVKADDAGVALARIEGPAAAPLRALGRGLVTGMPVFLGLLANIGTAAMLWVGGGIILHGLQGYGASGPADFIHHAAASVGQGAGSLAPLVEWLVGAVGAGVAGLVVGAVVVAVLHLLPRRH
jgi:predicted DNA repair protein MutK